ncbi:MAG TPA: hypothetical protein VGN11_03955 [Candidatus Baltobacteraceae bacterium]|jgi:hypothetical protein|nr:hypothetical protein [Candidatus Baltobacteraceae bacterium]
MNDYVIGSGALLTAGPNATISAATLHAQTDAALAPAVKAAMVDFESSSGVDLSQVLVLAAGWNAGRFKAEIVQPLLARREVSLADILALLAKAASTSEVHLFARWHPDDVLVAALRRSEVTLVVHPLETIRQAALISGQTFSRWKSPLRAA